MSARHPQAKPLPAGVDARMVPLNGILTTMVGPGITDMGDGDLDGDGMVAAAAAQLHT